ncbi:O-succinylbenzoate synthase [Scopulibacillus daqui]|uniref:o-succinylbenzoate synthase n=1 Tax=Scopulibacillus daqui TaxID=1469162 RepID=A0ABS2Q3L1_9BACL|nr:O-succinylbenzoate synthase [Scopulibacillus daqui]
MTLKSPFATSFGSFVNKDFFVIEIVGKSGVSGWGESVAFSSPWYTEETVQTNEHIIKDFLIPLLRKAPIHHPDDLVERFAPIRRNNMAKAAIEGAVWDLYAREQNQPLYKALGGEKSKIDVGISIGIQPSSEALIKKIGECLDQGYKRIKIKIKPGKDIDVVKAVRCQYPDVPLMVDANSAYTLKDSQHLKKLDDFNLLMIEQPLAHDDMIDHAVLQKQMKTPICLDESINSLEDARKAIDIGACKVINIKIGRVGGLTVSKQIHDFCAKKGIPVWCGGMLEAGIGRAHNIALTTLPQFTLPGDTAGSSRYWEEDIIDPEVTVKNGEIEVPEKPGIGYNINRDAMNKFTVYEEKIKL